MKMVKGKKRGRTNSKNKKNRIEGDEKSKIYLTERETFNEIYWQGFYKIRSLGSNIDYDYLHYRSK